MIYAAIIFVLICSIIHLPLALVLTYWAIIAVCMVVAPVLGLSMMLMFVLFCGYGYVYNRHKPQQK